jgi:hypothetical protein
MSLRVCWLCRRRCMLQLFFVKTMYFISTTSSADDDLIYVFQLRLALRMMWRPRCRHDVVVDVTSFSALDVVAKNKLYSDIEARLRIIIQSVTHEVTSTHDVTSTSRRRLQRIIQSTSSRSCRPRRQCQHKSWSSWQVGIYDEVMSSSAPVSAQYRQVVLPQ